MNWTKLNSYKIPILIGSFIIGFVFLVFVLPATYYMLDFRVPRSHNLTQNSSAPVNKTETIDLKIKGNNQSRIYHLPGCPNYEDIAERNIVWFKTHEDAKARKYRMARNC